MRQRRALIAGDHQSGVLHGSRPIEECPPIHGSGRPPGIHVGADSNEDLGTVEGQLANRFRKQPVVADDPQFLRVLLDQLNNAAQQLEDVAEHCRKVPLELSLDDLIAAAERRCRS